MPYHIGSKLGQKASHHESVKALWDTKWRFPCSKGIYPFFDGKLEDFELVFNKLSDLGLKPPYDFDLYASTFFPAAENLEKEGDSALSSDDKAKASQLYLRAAALYRISRFPIPRAPKQKEAWTRNKAVYLKGTKLLENPITETLVPHTHATEDEGSHIPVYVRLPPSASITQPVPCIIQIFGLDGYRTEFTHNSSNFLSHGWGCIAVEIPGTGDCPASKTDPKSPDRLWSSLLDWLDGQEVFDKNMRCVWGLSTGGYYAMRIAHTHKDRLRGVVAQGGGCHAMFDEEWLDAVDAMEYPFDLAESMAYKFGYKNVDEMKHDAKKRFSLLDNGILDMPSTRLLLANGMSDEIFPIEDSLLPLQHGDVKEARFIPNAKHMGEPWVAKPIFDWVDKLFVKE